MGRPLSRCAAGAAVALAAGPTALAGCGAAGGPIGPSLRSLPLLPGARVVVSTRQCDSGANAFCALEAVVAQPRARNSQALVASERRLLSRLGWHPTTADTKHEQAASSPGRKLVVTYATPVGDLADIDVGTIRRARVIQRTLAGELFERTPAMSVMLEFGPG